MKKILLTVCTLALFTGVGCKNKSHQSTNGINNTLDSIPSSTFEELDKKVGDKVFFAFDNSNLSDSAKTILDRQVEFMKDNSHLKFVLEGCINLMSKSSFFL